jgi:hypothetical protein
VRLVELVLRDKQELLVLKVKLVRLGQQELRVKPAKKVKRVSHHKPTQAGLMLKLFFSLKAFAVKN